MLLANWSCGIRVVFLVWTCYLNDYFNFRKKISRRYMQCALATESSVLTVTRVTQRARVSRCIYRRTRGSFFYWCNICQKGFPVKTNYDHHMAKHKGMTFPCNLCEKRFKSKIGLTHHLSEHTGNFIHRCDLCSKGFNHKERLAEHMRKGCA